MRIYSRDLLNTQDEKGLKLSPLIGLTVTSAVFVSYDKVVLTFDTGATLEVREEAQAGDISVDVVIPECDWVQA